MERMVRKQVYIEARQDQELKRKAREVGVSEAEIIRAGLNYLFLGLERQRDSAQKGGHPQPVQMLREAPETAYLAAGTREEEGMSALLERALGGKGHGAFGAGVSVRDRAAWEEELTFMRRRAEISAEGVDRGRWSREELYDERL